jgi:hypothetical protein
LRERYVKEIRATGTLNNYQSKFKHFEEMAFLRDCIKFRSIKFLDNSIIGDDSERITEPSDDEENEFVITQEDLNNEDENPDDSDIFIEFTEEEHQSSETSQKHTALQNELNIQQLKETCFNRNADDMIISGDLALEDFECDELDENMSLNPMEMKHQIQYENVYPPHITHVIIADNKELPSTHHLQQHQDEHEQETQFQQQMDLIYDQNSCDGSKSSHSNDDNFETEAIEPITPYAEEEPEELAKQEPEEDEIGDAKSRQTDGDDRSLLVEPPPKKFKRKKRTVKPKTQQKYLSYTRNEDVIFGELIASMLMKVKDENQKKNIKKDILSMFF